MVRDLDKIYEQILEPLQEIEKKRIVLKNRVVSQTLITLIIIFIVFLIILFTQNIIYIFTQNILLALVVFAVIGILIGVMFCYSKRVELSEQYKGDIVNQMVESILPDAKFQPKNGISEASFGESLLFSKSVDKYSSEDCVTGTVDKTEFQFSEVHAEEEYYDGKQTTWVDIFKGFFFIADFHKDFQGITIIKRDRLIKFSPHGGMDRVKLENSTFEKIFDVFGTDQIEARYLLTPLIMERLVALDTKLSTGIMLSFRNSMVNIAIPQNTNNFEASIFSTMLNKKKIEKEFGLLIALIQIVEDLNLNTRIWSKE